jgi:hypothetical protein
MIAAQFAGKHSGALGGLRHFPQRLKYLQPNNIGRLNTR